VAISPIPIIGVVLMLATPRARANGLGFLAGWVLGLAVAGTIVLLVAGGAGATDQGQPATWTGWLKLALGLLLVALAVKQWRGRPTGDEQPELPKWMQTIDTFSAPRALGFGFLLAAVNPKNLVLTVAAAASIAQDDLSDGQSAVALAVFVLVGTLGPGIPVGIYFGMGDRAAHVLGGLRDWMGRNNTAIMAVLFLVIGAKLVGDGISVLST
jgi:threonine/homoserine/homoserine lactone efflux protein